MEDPKFTEYINPLIAALDFLGGSARPKEVYNNIAEKMNLSDDVINKQKENSGSQFQNRIDWAKFFLKKAGFVESLDHGVWRLTEKGRYKKYFSEQEIEQIVKEVHNQSKNLKKRLADKAGKFPLDIISVKIAIIEILRSRGNKSCLRDNLTPEVIKYFGLTLRGKSLYRVTHLITDALSSLKQARLVEQHRTINSVMVKLSNFNNAHYDDLISDWEKKITVHNADSLNNNSSENQKTNVRNHINIPVKAMSDCGFPSSSAKYEDKPLGHDNGTSKLLHTLTVEDYIKEPETTRDHSGNVHDIDMLTKLTSRLNSTPNLKAEQLLNEIKATVKLDSWPLEFQVEYQPEHEKIFLKSYFPIKKRNPSDLLLLCGQINFTSTLGVAKYKNRHIYIVHKTLSLNTHFLLDQVYKSIMQFVIEINRVNVELEE